MAGDIRTLQAASPRRRAWFSLSLAAALTATLALSGCGSNESDSSSDRPATVDRPSGPLDGPAIREHVIGNTVIGTMGADTEYSEYYAPDGIIHGVSYEASWTIDDDRMCFNYDESPQIDCYTVVLDGDRLTWRLQGENRGEGRILQGNPNDL